MYTHKIRSRYSGALFAAASSVALAIALPAAGSGSMEGQLAEAEGLAVVSGGHEIGAMGGDVGGLRIVAFEHPLAMPGEDCPYWEEACNVTVPTTLAVNDIYDDEALVGPNEPGLMIAEGEPFRGGLLIIVPDEGGLQPVAFEGGHEAESEYANGS